MGETFVSGDNHAILSMLLADQHGLASFDIKTRMSHARFMSEKLLLEVDHAVRGMLSAKQSLSRCP